MGKFLWFFSCFVFSSHVLIAEAHLDRLFEYDQKTCEEILHAAEPSDLWNYFLRGQANLYITQDEQWLSQKGWWTGAQNILELGSGNGVYLSLLSERFTDKRFLGVENQPLLVKQSDAEFGRSGLAFIEGDAERDYEQYRNQFDIVLYRLTLQHLKNPKHSLKLAHQYLKQDGYVIIIDSYDPARISSHEFPSLDKVASQIKERNQAAAKVNRRISIEILEELQNRTGSLSPLYEVVHTSLDIHGNRLERGIRFESEQDRKRYLNQNLLFMTIWKKIYGISVDLGEAYSELQAHLENDNYWTSPGIHYLVLKKI